MLAKEEFCQKYQSQFETELKEFNKNKNEFIKTTALTFGVLLVVFLPIVVFFQIDWVFFIVSMVMLTIFRMTFFDKGLEELPTIKAKIFTKISQIADPTLTFVEVQNSELKQKGENYVKSSLLFEKLGYSKLEMEDFFTNNINPALTNFEFFEVGFYKEYKSEGKVESRLLTQGLFFISDFPDPFEGQTLVFSNGYLGFNRIGERVKLESPVFMKNYDVYSTSQFGARLALTTSTMDYMNQLKDRLSVNILYSFVGNKIYIYIANNKDLFELSYFQKDLDINQIYSHYLAIMEVLGLVKILKLDRKDAVIGLGIEQKESQKQ